MDIDHEVMKKVFGGGFWESSIIIIVFQFCDGAGQHKLQKVREYFITCDI